MLKAIAQRDLRLYCEQIKLPAASVLTGWLGTYGDKRSSKYIQSGSWFLKISWRNLESNTEFPKTAYSNIGRDGVFVYIFWNMGTYF